MSELPAAQGAPTGMQQFDLPLASLAPGEYIVEINDICRGLPELDHPDSNKAEMYGRFLAEKVASSALRLDVPVAISPPAPASLSEH